MPEKSSHRETTLITTIALAGLTLRLVVLLLPHSFDVIYRVPDDALYYLTIAKHLAHGHGITFDGLRATNGIHPLWLFIITPIFRFDLPGWGGITAVLALQTFLDVVILWLIGA